VSKHVQPDKQISIMHSFVLTRPLVFFDLETTGISVQQDRIVEIAAVKLLPRASMKEFVTRVNPEIPIPVAATEVHGISDADVALAPTFRQIADKLLKFLEGCDISGFNVRRYDLPMLIQEFSRCDRVLEMSGRHVVDVQTIYHLKEARDLSAALRFYCDREHDGAHGALADVRATIDVFNAQLLRYDDLPRKIAELEKAIHPRDPDWIDDEGRFVWQNGVPVIAIGKHRGMSLHKLISEQRNYLEWMLGGNFSESTKKLIREALAGNFPSPPTE